MSSLRNDTLRLCWLETFLAVAENENLSAAANQLGFNQSTVTRYMQDLEQWTGKKLIDTGSIFDEEDARISVGITNEGRNLYDISIDIIDKLTSFRDKEAQLRAMRLDMSGWLSRIRRDVDDGMITYNEQSESELHTFESVFEATDGISELDPIHALHGAVRILFQRHERETGRAKRMSRRKRSKA